MALQSSGPISLNDVHKEGYYPGNHGAYGGGAAVSGTACTMNDQNLRSITDNYTSTSQISLGDFYGDQYAHPQFGKTNVLVGKRVQSYSNTSYEIVTMYANDNITNGTGGQNEYNNHLNPGFGESQGSNAIFASSNYSSVYTNEISQFRCGSTLYNVPRETVVKIQSSDSNGPKANPRFDVVLLDHSASNTWVLTIGHTNGTSITVSPGNSFTYSGATFTWSAQTNTNLGLANPSQGIPVTNVTQFRWLRTNVTGGGAALWGHGLLNNATYYTWSIT